MQYKIQHEQEIGQFDKWQGFEEGKDTFRKKTTQSLDLKLEWKIREK